MVAIKNVADNSGDRFNNLLSPTFGIHEKLANIDVAGKKRSQLIGAHQKA